MRRLSPILLWSCLALRAQPTGIQGVAVNAANGQPLGGVHVRLVQGTFQNPGAVYGAISGRDGRFSIAALQPGSYLVTAERTGYADTARRRTLTLKPGQHILNYRLEMAQRAVIAGRVVDEYGDPVENVAVQAVAVSGDMSLAPGLHAQTDDRGEFRLRGAPGKYYVEARPPDYRPGPAGDETVYPTTFFPNVTSKERAAAVEAVAGGDITGIEIRLARLRGLTISGFVRGAPGEPPMRASIMLESGESRSRITRSEGTSIGPGGEFAFNRLQPGFYRVYAQYASGGRQLVSTPVELNLDSADVTNLEIVLSPAGELAGTLEIAGAPDERLPAAPRKVRLQPARFGFGMVRTTGGQVDKDGAFRIASVPPTRFRVHVDPLPESAYIKAIELDSAAAAGDVLDLSRGVGLSRMKIVLGRNGGQLSGTVRDPEGVPSTGAVVFLLADPDDFWPEEDLAKVSGEARYSFKAIRPGTYKLFAIDPAVTPGVWPDVWKPMIARTDTIEIREGDRLTRDLKVMTREDASAPRKP